MVADSGRKQDDAAASAFRGCFLARTGPSDEHRDGEVIVG
jgi:hypothetical protein